ncbi:hypothetical protein MAPG_04109 [Magnaporthiopsis poae ATCC 64411]|uniref:Uncharacterized protein n=1 Tax=Magnaporthiopsis poae (strain ATCC 64411 / 73-15) TaxID=644358 RepID=A0A0C4DVU6_MAGP6|nr:hypothetical protein MAPG_04109 [Magnaporthiopsis poae ATCC 64411]
MLGEMERYFYAYLRACAELMPRQRPEDFVCLSPNGKLQDEIIPLLSDNQWVHYSATLSTLGLDFLNAFKQQPRERRNQFVFDTFRRTCKDVEPVGIGKPLFALGMRASLYNDTGGDCIPVSAVSAAPFVDATDRPNFAWDGLRGMIGGALPANRHFATRDHGWALWDADILQSSGAIWRRVFMPPNMAEVCSLGATINPRKISIGILSARDFEYRKNEFVVKQGELLSRERERGIKFHLDTWGMLTPAFPFAASTIGDAEIEARHGDYWRSYGLAHLLARIL